MFLLHIVRGHCEKNDYLVNLPIGEDSRPEISKIKVATSDSEYCVKPRSAETKIHVLSRGSYHGDPVTKGCRSIPFQKTLFFVLKLQREAFQKL